MTFKIEKGIPIPASKNKPGNIPQPHQLKYPWPDMQEGDSFLVRIPMGATARTIRNRMQIAGNRWCKKNQPDMRVFASRWDEDHVRVWKGKRDSGFDLSDDPIEQG